MACLKGAMPETTKPLVTQVSLKKGKEKENGDETDLGEDYEYLAEADNLEQRLL